MIVWRGHDEKMTLGRTNGGGRGGRGLWVTHWCGREKEGEVENGSMTLAPVAGKTNRSELREEASGDMQV